MKLNDPLQPIGKQVGDLQKVYNVVHICLIYNVN